MRGETKMFEREQHLVERGAWSRRAFLKLAAGGASASLLVACQTAGPAGAPATAAAPATSAPTVPPRAAPATTAPATLAPTVAAPTVAAAQPTPAAAAPAAAGASAAKPGSNVPTFLPAQGPQPDYPGTASGVDPGFIKFPAQLSQTVHDTPAAGGSVSGIVLVATAVPTPVDVNPAWQQLNTALGTK